MSRNRKRPGQSGIYTRLYQERILHNLSREDLAELADVSSSTIKDIELGNRFPHPDTLNKLADALRIPVTNLLTQDREQADGSIEPQPPTTTFVITGSAAV